MAGSRAPAPALPRTKARRRRRVGDGAPGACSRWPMGLRCTTGTTATPRRRRRLKHRRPRCRRRRPPSPPPPFRERRSAHGRLRCTSATTSPADTTSATRDGMIRARLVCTAGVRSRIARKTRVIVRGLPLTLRSTASARSKRQKGHKGGIGLWFRVRVSGFWFRVSGFGFLVSGYGLWFMVYGSRFSGKPSHGRCPLATT